MISSLSSYVTVILSSSLTPYSVIIGYPAVAFISGCFGISKSSTYIFSETSVIFPASSVPFAYIVNVPSSFAKFITSYALIFIFPV